MSVQILNEELEERILQIAREERRQPTEVVDEALHLYLKRRSTVDGEDYQETPIFLEGSSDSTEEGSSEAPDITFLLSVAGLGSSGQRNIARNLEEILAAELKH